MVKVHHHQDGIGLAGRLLAFPRVDRPTQMRVEANLAGNCLSPSGVAYYARPEAPQGHREVVVAPGKAHSLHIEMDVRCRRCESCRRNRQNLWRRRAETETAHAVRSWFCTLTIAPEKQDRFLWEARERLSGQGVDYDALDFGDQFRTRVQTINPEITKFMKRLRKPLPDGAVRFLWVAEQHKSGDPHFHALLHEQMADHPLRKSVLEEQWKLGFGQFRLVRDNKQAAYVCKYLGKSLAARV